MAPGDTLRSYEVKVQETEHYLFTTIINSLCITTVLSMSFLMHYDVCAGAQLTHELTLCLSNAKWVSGQKHANSDPLGVRCYVTGSSRSRLS